jgi:hypothetical protein
MDNILSVNQQKLSYNPINLEIIWWNLPKTAINGWWSLYFLHGMDLTICLLAESIHFKITFLDGSSPHSYCHAAALAHLLLVKWTSLKVGNSKQIYHSANVCRSFVWSLKEVNLHQNHIAFDSWSETAILSFNINGHWIIAWSKFATMEIICLAG